MLRFQLLFQVGNLGEVSYQTFIPVCGNNGDLGPVQDTIYLLADGRYYCSSNAFPGRMEQPSEIVPSPAQVLAQDSHYSQPSNRIYQIVLDGVRHLGQ